MEDPRILIETDRWVVVEKPAGWLSIPGRSEAPVLSDWVRKIHPQIFVVHRLDRETSGVLLFARNAEAHRLANGWFEKHLVKKTYDFLATRSPGLPKPTLPEIPMMKSQEPIEGLSSATQFEVKEKFKSAFLGRAIPLSGRRHQIRIHASRLGFPILGDSEYRGPKTVGKLEIERVALHARSLELPSGEKFEAPWPEDFSSWVQNLRAEK